MRLRTPVWFDFETRCISCTQIGLTGTRRAPDDLDFAFGREEKFLSLSGLPGLEYKGPSLNRRVARRSQLSRMYRIARHQAWPAPVDLLSEV